MSNLPQLLYSGTPYEGSPYIIELYDNASMHIIHKEGQEKTIIVTPEEIRTILIYYPNRLVSDPHFQEIINALPVFSPRFLRQMKEFSLLPPLDKDLVLTKKDFQQKFIDTYKKLHDAIEKGAKEAQEQGKKLLIVSGEQHNSFHSTVINFMLIKICADRGITNLLFETNPDLVDEDNAMKAIGICVTGIDSLSDKVDFTNRFSWKDFSEKRAVGHKLRAEDINNNIAKCHESALAIVGALHLFHICAPELAGTPKLPQYLTLPITHHQMKLDNVTSTIRLVVEKIILPKLELELENEFNTLRINETINLEDFKKYAEEKKLSVTLFLNSGAFMRDPTVLQLPMFITDQLNIRDIYDMTLHAIKHFHNENDVLSTKHLAILEKLMSVEFNTISEASEVSEVELFQQQPTIERTIFFEQSLAGNEIDNIESIEMPITEA